MAANHTAGKHNGRHAILDLAPLELDCLSVLWPIGEGTVRDIREGLRASRPRAYTTIMTIMDRMAQKGIVSRRKAGRAWLYSPNVTAGEARERAVRRLVEHFFAGSAAALRAQLEGESAPEAVTNHALEGSGPFGPPPERRELSAPARGIEKPARRKPEARERDVETSPSAAASAPKMDDALL